YKARPEKGPVALEIGLTCWRDSRELGLWHLLAMPFRGSRPRQGSRQGARGGNDR
ncbi:MAG: sterol desaturase family protein, partial [Alphaproteobacteria bacterium]